MSRPNVPDRTAAGFTLVEVLVAMLIMATMAVMAWQGVDGIVRTRDASQARMERTLRLGTVVAQWDHDLAAVQKTDALPSVLRCDGASVRMVRRTPDGLQVVAWTYRPDAATGAGAWVRWAAPPVTTAAELVASWQRSLQLFGNEPESLRTLVGLASWQVYFFRNNAWSNCQSSGDVDQQNRKEDLPAGVRIVLGFATGGETAGELTRDSIVQTQ